MADQEKERLVSSSDSAPASASATTSASTSAVAGDDDSNQSASFAPHATAGAIPTLKCITLGQSSVGKTSLIARFIYDAYDRHYRATLGIDFLTKMVSVHGQTVKLALWDTAGQERFRSLIPSYIRNSAGAIIVYDVTNRESFVDVMRWVEDVRQERGKDSGIVFFLVANKIDLEKERVVTSDEGEARAREIGASYIEVSAKTGVNVKALFRKVSTTIPLPEAPSGGGGGVGGGGGIMGAGGVTGLGGIPAVRRLDPLRVAPAGASDGSGGGSGDGGSGASAGGICGC